MPILRSLVASGLLAGAMSNHQLVAEEPFPDPDWKYLLRFPGKGWFAPDFDDSKWRSGPGGFGERSTPGARVGTDWTTKNVWLRRTVDIGGSPRSRPSTSTTMRMPKSS